MNIMLWIVQVLLAVIFMFAGGTKFVMSVEQMNAQAPIPLPGLFLHFIGACEVLGAIGLIVPWATGIKPYLTPLSAIGLAIIMTGATALTIAGGQAAMAAIPLIVGLLAAFVAYGRRPMAVIERR